MNKSCSINYYNRFIVINTLSFFVTSFFESFITTAELSLMSWCAIHECTSYAVHRTVMRPGTTPGDHLKLANCTWQLATSTWQVTSSPGGQRVEQYNCTYVSTYTLHIVRYFPQVFYSCPNDIVISGLCAIGHITKYWEKLILECWMFDIHHSHHVILEWTISIGIVNGSLRSLGCALWCSVIGYRFKNWLILKLVTRLF